MSTPTEWLSENGGRTATNKFAHQKDGKARFDHIYNQPDPRQYFQTLRSLEYETPAHGQAVFSELVTARRQHSGRDELTILDLCCSYGINAALLNHNLALGDLYARYSSPEVAALTTGELAASDISFFEQHRRDQQVEVVGVDTADNAVAYALRTGLLAAGSSENLEHVEPPSSLAPRLAHLDLITVTGGIGYISERTFARVLDRAPSEEPPWVAAFALRWVPFGPIEAVLRRYGLVVEKFTGGTFTQRRFADAAERSYVLGELARLGINPTGKETEGRYHAELYVARPAHHARAHPLDDLLVELG